MRYLVVLEEGPTSWGAFVPGLPGCIAVGASCEETLRLIREAIPVHLEEMRSAGEAVPEPRDAGFHRRRLTERLLDPDFRAAYELAAREIAEADAAVWAARALARAQMAARVAERELGRAAAERDLARETDDEDAGDASR